MFPLASVVFNILIAVLNLGFAVAEYALVRDQETRTLLLVTKIHVGYVSSTSFVLMCGLIAFIAAILIYKNDHTKLEA